MSRPASSAPSLTVVIPAYNEAVRLRETLRATLEAYGTRDLEILVVDDGSRDDTAMTALRLGSGRIHVIQLAANCGKGAAVRVGLERAQHARVLYMDADGSTALWGLRDLEQALDEGADIAIGSRAMPHATTMLTAHWSRRIAGRLFHLTVQLLAVRGLHDTQCGFKLLTREAAQSLAPRLRMPGFSFDVELLRLARARGLRISEVAVDWEHREGSKVRVVRDGLRMVRDLGRIRLNEWRGVYRSPAAPIALRAAVSSPAPGGRTASRESGAR